MDPVLADPPADHPETQPPARIDRAYVLVLLRNQIAVRFSPAVAAALLSLALKRGALIERPGGTIEIAGRPDDLTGVPSLAGAALMRCLAKMSARAPALSPLIAVPLQSLGVSDAGSQSSGGTLRRAEGTPSDHRRLADQHDDYADGREWERPRFLRRVRKDQRRDVKVLLDLAIADARAAAARERRVADDVEEKQIAASRRGVPATAEFATLADECRRLEEQLQPASSSVPGAISRTRILLSRFGYSLLARTRDASISAPHPHGTWWRVAMLELTGTGACSVEGPFPPWEGDHGECPIGSSESVEASDAAPAHPARRAAASVAGMHAGREELSGFVLESVSVPDFVARHVALEELVGPRRDPADAGLDTDRLHWWCIRFGSGEAVEALSDLIPPSAPATVFTFLLQVTTAVRMFCQRLAIPPAAASVAVAADLGPAAAVESGAHHYVQPSATSPNTAVDVTADRPNAFKKAVSGGSPAVAGAALAPVAWLAGTAVSAAPSDGHAIAHHPLPASTRFGRGDPAGAHALFATVSALKAGSTVRAPDIYKALKKQTTYLDRHQNKGSAWTGSRLDLVTFDRTKQSTRLFSRESVLRWLTSFQGVADADTLRKLGALPATRPRK